MSDGPHDTHIIAARGADFQTSDLIDSDAPFLWRRFIRAGHAGPVWFLWYEHTGVGYVRMATFVRYAAPRPASLLAHVAYNGVRQPGPCAMTDAVIRGQLPPADLTTDWW